MQIKVKRIVPLAKLPSYGHPGDAGMDLYSALDRTLGAGRHASPSRPASMAIPRDSSASSGTRAASRSKASTGWPESSMPATAARSRWC